MLEERADRHRLPLLLGLGLTVVLAVYLRAAHPPEIVEDAYITFRYANNLARGAGFVYNPGERVLGTTTPLYTLLLTPGALLFGSGGLARWATSLNAAFDGACVLLLWALARRLGARPLLAIGAPLLYALSDESAIFAIGGMETSLYVALLLGAVYLLLRRQIAGAGFVAALAVLTRPDALILALLLALGWTAHLRREAKQPRPQAAAFARQFGRQEVVALLLFALPLLAWSVFGWLYFGSPVPEALSAKRLAYSSDVRWWQLAYEFLRHGPPAVFGNLGLRGGAERWAVALHVILFGAGIAWMVRRDRLAWPLGVFPVVYGVIISAGSPFLFQWYITPAIPFWLLGVVLGMGHLLDGILQRLGRRRPHGPWALSRAACFALLLFLAALEQRSHFKARGPYLHPRGLRTERESVYRQTALQLRDVIPATSRVALAEIGAFGFYHPAAVLDAVGLVSPQAQRCYPLPKSRYHWNSAVPPRLIEEQKPEYVVAFRDFMRLSLLPSASFRAAYRWLGTFPHKLWESPGPWVYRRIPRATVTAQLARARSAFANDDFAEGFRQVETALAYSRESRAEALELLDQALCNRLSALNPWENRFASGAFCDLEHAGDNGAWQLLDRWGRMFTQQEGRLVLSGAVSGMSLDVVAVDLESSEYGWVVLDSLGAVHPVGSGAKLPDWMLLPVMQEVADAVDLEFAPSGEGLYVLDAYGGLQWRSSHPARSGAVAQRRWEFPVARDVSLSPNGKHLYIIDSFGGVHHLGPGGGHVASPDPPYWGWDAVRDAEWGPGGDTLLLATGMGSVHPYGSTEGTFSSTLPYPGWDYLIDIEVDPETGQVFGLDSNGHLYEPEE